MNPASSIPPEGGQDWQVTYEHWRYPFSTQITDCAVPHNFVQLIDCLMSNPCPGDTNWIPGTSGWREGVSTPPLNSLVPVPGCLTGSEPATCSRTPPAGRKLTPAATSATGRKSSAGPETPPLVPLLRVGPCNLTVSDHELCAQCMGEERACATTTARDAGEKADEEADAETAGIAGCLFFTCCLWSFFCQRGCLSFCPLRAGFP